MIDLNELKRNLTALSMFGYEEGAGITRRAYGASYKEAEQFIIRLMEEADLEIRKDPVGNLFGRLKGSGETKKSIIMGSHFDTVPHGGMFDGSIGVMGALECIKAIKKEKYTNLHPIEIAAFIGEEGTPLGGTFGSRCFSGQINIEERHHGVLNEMGLSIDDVLRAKRRPKTIKSYLELHVEQSNILYSNKKTIGIVKGIPGIYRYKAQVDGMANHAGTTPMGSRDDALVKACNVILKIDEIARSYGPPLVATVGYVTTHPGAVNVIPGKAEFPIEVRDLSPKTIDSFLETLQGECRRFSLILTGLEIKEEAWMDRTIQQTIQKASDYLNYTWEYMYSGASHDASPISKIAPAGMIFIPSKDGISHSPGEFSEWDDIKAGTDVLLHTLLALDRKPDFQA